MFSYNKLKTYRVAMVASLALASAAFLATAQTAVERVLDLTATTANASGSDDEITIELLRWSSDEERDQLISAWTMPKAPEQPTGGRGRGGFGGFGKGKGGDEVALPPSPEESLDTALQNTETLGYIWTPEVAGYAIKYAVQLDGGRRVILITNRRLGASPNVWNPPGANGAMPYEFSLVELHLDANGSGEGRVSFSSPVSFEEAAKTLALANYDASSVVFANVAKP